MININYFLGKIMKKGKVIKYTYIILFFTIFFFSISSQNKCDKYIVNDTDNKFSNVEENNNIKNSKFWNLYGEAIYIKNNWSDADDEYEWIQYINNEYLIENISIDVNNANFGIYIENSLIENFRIRNCTIYNSNLNGIRIRNSGSGIIEDCKIYDNYFGINIEAGSSAIVVQDSDINNNIYGIYLMSSDYNTIRWNNITLNDNGIDLTASDSLNILNNNISLNNDRGIYTSQSNDCWIEGNTISHNGDGDAYYDGGVYWKGGTNNVILSNDISFNYEGIYFDDPSSIYVGIANNNITYNNRNGISLMTPSFSNMINIMNNNISNNNKRGINVYYAFNTTIKNNYIGNNGDHGIVIAVDHNTTISDNTIFKNTGYGIWHPDEFSPRKNLIIRNNTISGNVDYNIYLENFADHSVYPGKFTLNKIIGTIATDRRDPVYDTYSWNNNYFSYYNGIDANDDGIGDSPQTLYNQYITIEDKNPLWWDSPIITLQSPNTDEWFNKTPPPIS